MAAVLGVATIEESTAQTAKPAQAPKAAPAAAAKTTLSGVYTQSQADKGEEIYYGICITCHPKGTYAGASFKSNWNGRPLTDLYDWVKTKMPKSDPGSLTASESVQVMSYILQQNKMPTGSMPMSTDRSVLSRIKIQLK